MVLPDRYWGPWHELFEERIEPSLAPAVRILDVGSGRRPALEPGRRPAGCRYVGLDISSAELAAAPPGSYDDRISANAVDHIPDLVGEFDLIISWQVLEHLKPLKSAIGHFRSYLRAEGRFVAMLSGRYAAFAVINRTVPNGVGRWWMKRLLQRNPETVFPARYDGCYHGALSEAFSDWTRSEITPFYRGAGYFRFSAPLQRIYLRYEDWALRRAHHNLATHYLIDASR